ncbi:MAG: hypothetical protein IJR83_01355 [Clostridia bacterium]|nr:hypothetical protein [Clostridia bacterium]
MLTKIKSKTSILRGLALILAVIMVASVALVACSDATAQKAAETAQATAEAAQQTANEAKAAAASAVTTATVQGLLADALADYVKTADAFTQAQALDEIAKALADYAKKSDIPTTDLAGFATKTELTNALAAYVKGADVYTKAQVDAMIAAVSGGDSSAAIAEAVAQAKAYTDAAIAALTTSTGVDEAVVKQYLAEHDLEWNAATEEIQTFAGKANALIQKINGKVYTGNDWGKVLEAIGEQDYFETNMAGDPPASVPGTLHFTATYELVLQRALSTEELDSVLQLLENAAAVVTISDKVDEAVTLAKGLTSTLELKDIAAVYLNKNNNVITLNDEVYVGAFLAPINVTPSAYYTFGANNGVYVWDVDHWKISAYEFDKTVAHAANEVFWFTTYTKDANQNDVLASATLGKLTEAFTANGTPKYDVVKVVTATGADVEAYEAVKTAKLAIAQYLEAQTELTANATAVLHYGNQDYVLAGTITEMFTVAKGEGSLKWAENNNNLNALIEDVNAEAGVKIDFVEFYIAIVEAYANLIKNETQAGGQYYNAQGAIIVPANANDANAYKAHANAIEAGINNVGKVFMAQETATIAKATQFVADLRSAADQQAAAAAAAAAAANAQAASDNYDTYRQQYVTRISNLVAELTAAYQAQFATLQGKYNVQASMTTIEYANQRVSNYYLQACEVEPDDAMAAITGLAKNAVGNTADNGYNLMGQATFTAKLNAYIEKTYTALCTGDCVESWFKDTLYPDVTYYTTKIDAYAALYYRNENADVAGNYSDAVFYTLAEYNTAHSTNLTQGEFDALTDEQKTKTPAVTNRAHLTEVLTALATAQKAVINGLKDSDATYTAKYAAMEDALKKAYYETSDKYLEVIVADASTAANVTAAKNALDAFFTNQVHNLLEANGALGSEAAIQTILNKYKNLVDGIAINPNDEYPYLSFLGTNDLAHALAYAPAADIADYIAANEYAASGAFDDLVAEGKIAMLKDTYNAIVTVSRSGKITALTTYYSDANTGIVADDQYHIHGTADRETVAQVIYNKGYKNLLDFALTFKVPTWTKDANNNDVIAKDSNNKIIYASATFEEYAANGFTAQTETTVGDAIANDVTVLMAEMNNFLNAGGAAMTAYVDSCEEALLAYANYCVALDANGTALVNDKAAKIAPWAADENHPEYVHRNAAIAAYYADATTALAAVAVPAYKIDEQAVSFTQYVNNFADVTTFKTAFTALLTATTTAQNNIVAAVLAKANAYNAYVEAYENARASALAGIQAAATINANGLSEAQAALVTGAQGAYKNYYVEGSEYALQLKAFEDAVKAFAAEMPTDKDAQKLYENNDQEAGALGLKVIINNQKAALNTIFGTMANATQRADLVQLTVTAIVAANVGV